MSSDPVVPSDARRTHVLGVPVDSITMEGAVDALWSFAGSGETHLVVTLNPEILLLATKDADFGAIVGRASLIIPDGIGLVRALRARSVPAVRVTGADLLLAYAKRRPSHRIAFVGGPPGSAATAAQILFEAYGLTVVCASSGPPDRKTAEEVAAHAPDVVFAAYGGRKQEMFLDEFLPLMGASVGVGVGGTFDYLSGIVPRAPRAVQSAGFEWLWRLAQEPWRIRRQKALPGFWLRERAARNRRYPDNAPC